MGVSFGGGSTGVTYNVNTGTYTKIGRQVTVNGQIALTNKGSSTGDASITGLPFTVGSTGQFFSAPSFWLNNVSYANQFQGRSLVFATSIELWEITEAGVITRLSDADFANNSEIIVTMTYFV
jgi:hypothetical protein